MQPQLIEFSVHCTAVHFVARVVWPTSRYLQVREERIFQKKELAPFSLSCCFVLMWPLNVGVEIGSTAVVSPTSRYLQGIEGGIEGGKFKERNLLPPLV